MADAPSPQTSPSGSPPATAKEQVVGVFLFALLLLAVVVAAIWRGVLPANDVSDIVKLLVAVLAGLLSYFIVGTMVVDASGAGITVKASAGCAVFALTVWIFFFRAAPATSPPAPQRVDRDRVDTVALACSGLRPTPPAAGALAGRPVNIGILKSGEIAFVRNIAESMRQDVEHCAKIAGFKPVWAEAVGPIDPSSTAADSVWKAKVHYLERQLSHADYWVPIGTQAAVHLRQVLGPDWSGGSVVFAGITDPICSNLVSTLTRRTDAANVGGSQYGGDPRDYVASIQAYFPQRRIVFVYDTVYPQDRCFVDRIRNHPLVSAGVLSILGLDHPPGPSDLQDTAAVYFSWYTLEAMFEDQPALVDSLLRNRVIVTTTRNNVQGTDLAAIGVVGNDFDIGERTAHALLRDLFGIQRLGNQDIELPGYLVVLNCRTAAARRLTFPPGLVAKAERVAAC